jgi:4-amino-4-deoxy-L-arabinose transferase-like glycosyltransferase
MFYWSVSYAKSQFFDLFINIVKQPLATSFLLLISIFLLSSGYVWRRDESHHVKNALVALVACFVATLCSIFIMGGLFSHYYVQVLPFFCLIIAVVTHMITQRYRGGFELAIITLLLCFLTIHNIPKLRGYTGSADWKNSAYMRAANYINSQHLSGKFVFAPNAVVINFLTDTLPPIAKIHHFNVKYDKIPEDFFQVPDYVVLIEGKIKKDPSFSLYLEEHYTLVYREDGFLVFKAAKND